MKLESLMLSFFCISLLVSTSVNCHKKMNVFSEISDVFRSSFSSFFENHVHTTKENIILGGIFAHLGLDPENLQGFAFDGLISAANMIGQIFTKEDGDSRSQKDFRTFSPFRFLLSQRQVVSLLTRMQNPDIVDLLLEEIEEKLQKAECAKLLVCKTTPFIKGMQKSLNFFMKREKILSQQETCLETKKSPDCQKEEEENAAWEKSNYEQKMYFFFPALEEVIKYGDHCDLRFPNCVY